ncbi:jg4341 [Pararge aegeria aegeria]|uniref:Jg4341 protein n=1 Tax=Pararge aegeria aegeria TaxID=348720 RepID=A0A8S4SEU4_9NEOP|nr:jg4341 [Pararge aegeria aegeria]
MGLPLVFILTQIRSNSWKQATALNSYRLKRGLEVRERRLTPHSAEEELVAGGADMRIYCNPWGPVGTNE